ncbi:MAG: hypothetical protein M3077_08230 [Candidatus Dormibacteraeota bacterium]|nr:hypothetical protein [Candidatus Dormibacteraeota bacterium]
MPFYKYDDAGWHAGGDFPDDLPYSQGGVHMAMISRGRVGPPRTSRFRDVAAWIVGVLIFGFGAVVLFLLALQWLRR